MARRLLAVALLALGFSQAASAVDAELRVISAEVQTCHVNPDSPRYGLTCGPAAAAALAPAAPSVSGGGIEVDVAGQVARAWFEIEAFTLDGHAVPAWAFELEQVSVAGFRFVDADDVAWPGLPGQRSELPQLTLSRAAGQADLAGTIRIGFRVPSASVWEWTRWTLEIEFASLPGQGAVACPGLFLALDGDGDGELDPTDSYRYDLPGEGVDDEGLGAAAFCAEHSVRTCGAADFRNDEPLTVRPGDCVRQEVSCGSRQAAPLIPRPAPTAACLGRPAIPDLDRDGEPDTTDRCPLTAEGSAIDGAGCSVAQFCALQPVAQCKRADFGNDEPTAKRPGDCARVVATAACGAAGTSP